jgi:SSS family solute:Na+ symporter
MANNGFHGSYFGMLAKVAATKGMFDGITDAASMDGITCIIGYRVTGWINGINAFILFFGYTTADSCLMAAWKHRN